MQCKYPSYSVTPPSLRWHMQPVLSPHLKSPSYINMHSVKDPYMVISTLMRAAYRSPLWFNLWSAQWKKLGCLTNYNMSKRIATSLTPNPIFLFSTPQHTANMNTSKSIIWIPNFSSNCCCLFMQPYGPLKQNVSLNWLFWIELFYRIINTPFFVNLCLLRFSITPPNARRLVKGYSNTAWSLSRQASLLSFPPLLLYHKRI